MAPINECIICISNITFIKVIHYSVKIIPINE